MKRIGIFFVACMVMLFPLFAVAEESYDFTALNMDGETVSFSDICGDSPALLVFFGTYCPPCRAEVPELISLYDRYKDKGLKVIGVSVDRSLNTVKRFVSKKGINYTVLFDNMQDGAMKYGVRYIPLNILIDKDGKIVYKKNPMPSEKEIESLLE